MLCLLEWMTLCVYSMALKKNSSNSIIINLVICCRDISLATKGLPKSMATKGDLMIVSTVKNDVLLIGKGTTLLATIKHDKTPTAVGISNDGTEVAIGYEDASVKFFTLKAGNTSLELVKEVKENKGEITCISYSPNGQFVALSDSQRMITVLETKNKEVSF